jgi:hypothetical protein
MFRKLFGWLDTPITSKEDDAIVYLFAGVMSCLLAVFGAIFEMWLFASMFVVLAASQLRLAWRHFRVWDAQKNSAAD